MARAPVGEAARLAAEQLPCGGGAEAGGVGAHQREALDQRVRQRPGRAAGEAGAQRLLRARRRADLDRAAERRREDADLPGDGQGLTTGQRVLGALVAVAGDDQRGADLR
ncbi:hypothetical protein ACFYNO_27920 [Kitasatospora sp. NPDC006697]|uniref:hypothetical protein n=1 Tax=Kitasatospora sp. NPDC006697 TaxID=3364020 RepID=UPI0036B594C4